MDVFVAAEYRGGAEQRHRRIPRGSRTKKNADFAPRSSYLFGVCYYNSSTERLTNLARASPLSWPEAKRAMSIN